MDQLSSSNTIQRPDARAIDLHIDGTPRKLSGWAAPADRERAGDELIVTLSAGPVLLGRLRRDQARPEILPQAGKEPITIGFEVPDYGLGAFARMTGLDELRVSVDGATAEISSDAASCSPLGMRHGVGKALRLVDLWIEGSRNLNLRFEGTSNAPRSLDAYQCVDSHLVSVCADRPVGGLTAIARLTLLNPFQPVLLLLEGDDGAIDAIDFLPFPSLTRGGLHSAERAISAHGADDVADTAAVSTDLLAAWMDRDADPSRCVSTVQIDPAVQTGLEPILNRDLLRWMRTLGVRASVAKSSSLPPEFITALLGKPDQAPVAGHTLHLPADSVPTLAALLRPLPADPAPQRMTGSFGISDWDRHGRVWSVWQPPLPEQVESLQFVEAPQFAPSLTVQGMPNAAGRPAAVQWPLTLAFRERPTRIGHTGPFEIASDHDASLLRRASTDAPQRMGVLVVEGTSSPDPTPLLESLLRQDGVEFQQVVICRSADADDEFTGELTRLFGDRHRILAVPATAGRLEQIVAVADFIETDKILVVDASTILPDHRTLATLAPMLDVQNVASAGCLLRAANDKMTPLSAGYAFAQIDLRSAPAVSFSSIDPAVWRGPSTYPVVANSIGLVLIRRDALRTLSAQGSTAMRPESDDLLLGMHCLAQGGINLCTTIVSAFTSAAARPSQAAVSIPYRLSPDELARIAESSTIVQRVA